MGEGVLNALWTLPLVIALDLVQLLLSGIAWRTLFTESRPRCAAYFRLRLIREGIDSLLPVAQIGGEVIGVRMLARLGIATAQAGANVFVDVTLGDTNSNSPPCSNASNVFRSNVSPLRPYL